MKDEIETFVKGMLENESLEELFERFDLTPEQVFLNQFEAGLIDEEVMKELMRFI